MTKMGLGYKYVPLISLGNNHLLTSLKTGKAFWTSPAFAIYRHLKKSKSKIQNWSGWLFFKNLRQFLCLHFPYMLICLVQLLVVSTKIDLSLIGNTFQQIIISAAIHWDYSLGSYRFLDPKYKSFSQHSKFSQGNSLISHIGEPTPLNWSRVQRKVVRHNVSSIAHSARSQKHSVLSIFVTNSLRKHV